MPSYSSANSQRELIIDDLHVNKESFNKVGSINNEFSGMDRKLRKKEKKILKDKIIVMGREDKEMP